MNLLLDTQAIIWYLEKDQQLGKQAVKEIMDADSVAISTITLFEITIKEMIDKLKGPKDLRATLEQKRFRWLAFNEWHAEAIKSFPTLARHDPFDRMLLAQAQTEGLIFMTADQALLTLGLDFVIDTRQ